MNPSSTRNMYTGIGLAVLATLIWSGNFIVARAVHHEVPPIALNFYRWLVAAIILLPFALKKMVDDWPAIKKSWHYLFWVSLMGVSLFNSFVYIGAHYTSAINLALIGTTTSPVMSVMFARIFLKEKVGIMKLLGMLLCIAGVLYLLSKGNIENLLSLRFGKGDQWMLQAAYCFAVYNTMVKKKPSSISPQGFLLFIFSLGTLLLLPFYFWESGQYPQVVCNSKLALSVLYLGLGASIICFLIWNKAIGYLGAGRTALFGNLIPVFSSIGSVLLLHEKITFVHLVSFLFIVTGLALANIRS